MTCLSAGVLAFFVVGVSNAACPPLLDHRVTTLQGERIDLCAYADRPILVVNTASKCGYTPQFEKLEALNKRYGRGQLLVLGFPSNDFRQELASNAEIASFCKLTYLVDFPMVEQGSVTGAAAHPFFRQLAAATGIAPRWNFHKYLIAPVGGPVYSYGSAVEPDSRQLLQRLTPMLAATGKKNAAGSLPR